MKFEHGREVVLVGNQKGAALVLHTLQAAALLGQIMAMIGKLALPQVSLRMLA
jgi:hypothetical protein